MSDLSFCKAKIFLDYSIKSINSHTNNKFQVIMALQQNFIYTFQMK